MLDLLPTYRRRNLIVDQLGHLTLAVYINSIEFVTIIKRTSNIIEPHLKLPVRSAVYLIAEACDPRSTPLMLIGCTFKGQHFEILVQDIEFYWGVRREKGGYLSLRYVPFAPTKKQISEALNGL